MLVYDSLSGEVCYYSIKRNTANNVVKCTRNVTATWHNQCVAEVRLYLLTDIALVSYFTLVVRLM